MTDISIGKSSNKEKAHRSPVKKGSYSKLKKQYENFKKKNEKSDLANSPVLKQKELEYLAALREAAQKEGFFDEAADIAIRESQIEMANTLSSIDLDKTQELSPEKRPVSQRNKPEIPYYTDYNASAAYDYNYYFALVCEACKNSKGIIDENTSRIINAFKQSDADLKGLPSLIKQFRDADESISPDKTEAVEILAHAGVSVNAAVPIINEFTEMVNVSTDGSQNSNLKKVVNLDLCRQMADFKAMELNDSEALNCVKFFNDDFLDRDEAITSFKKLLDAGISPDASINILDNLTFPAVDPKDVEYTSESINKVLESLTETDYKKNPKKASVNLLNEASNTICNMMENLKSKNKKNILTSSVNDVITLKKSLMSNRGNEEDERKSPINKLGISVIRMADNSYMIMKNNKITYSSSFEEGFISIIETGNSYVAARGSEAVYTSPKEEGKLSVIETDDSYLVMKNKEVVYTSPKENVNVNALKEEYNDAISKLEDNLLIDFSSKFKGFEGKIEPNGIRTITALRKAGVTYNHLLPLTDYCIENGGINSDKINTISTLKKSGCLSSDIIEIMDAINKTPEGKYDSEDITNACDYTSSVIGGKETAALVKETHHHPEVKDFFISIAPYFDNKSNLIKLMPLIESEDSIIDENAMDIIQNLAETALNSDKKIKEKDFIKCADDIIKEAMDAGEVLVSDDGAAICSVMCQNKSAPIDILKGLQLCKDKSGNIDTRLSEVLWQMSNAGANINQIEKFINSVCIDKCGNPNHYTARKMVNYFKQGKSLNEIMKFVNV